MSPVIANGHVLHRRPRNPSYACDSGLEVFAAGGMMKEASVLQDREGEQRAGLSCNRQWRQGKLVGGFWLGREWSNLLMTSAVSTTRSGRSDMRWRVPLTVDETLKRIAAITAMVNRHVIRRLDADQRPWKDRINTYKVATRVSPDGTIMPNQLTVEVKRERKWTNMPAYPRSSPSVRTKHRVC